VCVVVLQTGVVPPHCAFDTQGTHVAVGVSHAGVAPEQALALVAEHCAHAPDDWHAGVAPPHSPSPAQPRQVCVVVLQIGVVPPHCAFDTHGTHVPVVVKQTGVAPEQALAFVPEHWPQAPDDWHAGVAPPHSPSPEQPRQVCVVVLQIGVVPPHCAFDTHGTHVAAGV
jgi:hypothetical protein